MIIYKVFSKNYELKKGELMGMLIERRKDLRGITQVQSGMRWANVTFGRMIKDKKSMFIVPSELKLRSDTRWLVDKGIFTKEELFGISKLMDQGIKA
ncbi:MAG: hypothetical protein QME83_17495 [Thermodesulfobacteriota bacterium]|nr:hypothetical protein [Thermodesulfobacteriota bacterium]